ncbi:MAG: phytase [Armatimonadota bacterium]
MIYQLASLILFTQSVEFDADDPAFAYHASQPDKSLLIGTDKQEGQGALYAFDLSGKVVAKSAPLDRPNNVDVFDGSQSLVGKSPLAVVTERLRNRLKIFQVNWSGDIFIDVTGSTEVFASETGEDKAPMGVATWSYGGRSFVFVTPKAGGTSRHLEQLELKWNPLTKKVDAQSVRRFGAFSGKKETESIVVDSDTSRVFYSDEGIGIWVYDARPEAADRPLMLIRNPQHLGDHEGLAIMGDLLVSTDQRKERSYYWFYDKRSGIPRGGFSAEIDETDGIDIIDRPGVRLMAAMNSKGKNFALIPLDWVKKQVGRYPIGRD